MFLVVAMGPPGGGRTVISERLQSRFNLFNMTFPQVCCLSIASFTVPCDKLFHVSIKCYLTILHHAPYSTVNRTKDQDCLETRSPEE